MPKRAASKPTPAAKKAKPTNDSAPKKAQKLWGGRFSGETDPLFEEFNASITFDKALWKADIIGSQAYAKAICKAGVITKEEETQLVDGLALVAKEWKDGVFKIVKETDEDIHTANERRLGELVGSVAGKLHTGRSRNDQVATDIRLWCMEQITELKGLMNELLGTAAQRAEKDIDILMSGFTHLQPAQPVRWSHWVLSHAWAWQRDAQRLDDLTKRVKILPLGSGALAGNPFNIDRDFLAKELGFEGISPNSLDAVGDRDFVAEFLFWASLCMVHISQWAEDLIIFCSKKYVVCADAYSTGSSLMPQKKNPDALELLRGKSGRVLGALTGTLVLLKGLPRAYNKDLQEDKEPLFDAVKTLKFSLSIATGVLATLRPNPEIMKKDLSPFMLATDLAEYLVRKGVPFRETHHIAGEAVKLAEDRGVPLDTLTVEDLKKLHSAFQADVSKVWDFETSVESRSTAGGTSKQSVLNQVVQLRATLSD